MRGASRRCFGRCVECLDPVQLGSELIETPILKQRALCNANSIAQQLWLRQAFATKCMTIPLLTPATVLSLLRVLPATTYVHVSIRRVWIPACRYPVAHGGGQSIECGFASSVRDFSDDFVFVAQEVYAVDFPIGVESSLDDAVKNNCCVNSQEPLPPIRMLLGVRSLALLVAAARRFPEV